MDAFQEILTESVGLAIAKAFAAAGNQLPVEGTVFMSVSDPDKPASREIARHLTDMRFEIVATEGTAKHRPQVVDIIKKTVVSILLSIRRLDRHRVSMTRRFAPKQSRAACRV